MDYYQLVDDQLRSRGLSVVLGELVAAFFAAVLLGFAMLYVPKLLARAAFPQKPSHSIARESSVKEPTRKAPPVVPPVATFTAQTPTKALGKAPDSTLPSEEAVEPSPKVAVPSPVAGKALNSAQDSRKGETTREEKMKEDGGALLDDLLNAYFEEDQILDKALLDATTGKGQDELPVNRQPVAPKVGRKSDKESSVEKKMAEKMTSGLQSQKKKTNPSTAPTRTVQSTPSVAQSAQTDIDQLLDDFMAEETLLNEAVLDNAVAAAKQ